MNFVYAELEKNNIKANFTIEDQNEEIKDLNNNELLNSIKRRSEELRREWNGIIEEVEVLDQNMIE